MTIYLNPVELMNIFIILFYRTYGIVYKAINRVTGAQVAIKKFKDSDDDEYVSDPAPNHGQTTTFLACFNLTDFNFLFLDRFERQR